jgi:hypothetical protein
MVTKHKMLPRCTSPNTSVIYSDESSQQAIHFCVYGALYFWCPNDTLRSEMAKLDTGLAELKKHHKLGLAKWEEVPTPSCKLEGFKALIECMASYRLPLGQRINFKCLVVDTHKYPLDEKEITGRDPLVGYMKYMKYYTVFLTTGIMLAQRGYYYDISVDDFSSRPPNHDSRALAKYVEKRYLRISRKGHLKQRHSELKTAKEETSNLLQMVDVLTGAVAFCWNDGMLRDTRRSIGMKELIEVIRKSYGGVKLDGQQDRGPFRILEFIPSDYDGPSPTAPGEVRDYP